MTKITIEIEQDIYNEMLTNHGKNKAQVDAMAREMLGHNDNNDRFTPNAMLLCDFYKLSHREQYPDKTQRVYATWTPRGSRIKSIDKVVAFGFQGFVKEFLIDYFNKNFFGKPMEDVIKEYKRVVKHTLSIDNPPCDHIKALHNLGYLPIKITALKEGTLVPLRVPMLTIENTHDDFFWLTNYLETIMSSMLWMPSTSATLTLEYRKILEKSCEETGGIKELVPFLGHDFSMRGMTGMDSSARSGAGHLLSFVGTDTIPAIQYLEKYYNANVEKELVGCSVSATEHSVMCAMGQDELKAFKRLVTEVYPSGIISIVSDTWDLWSIMKNILPKLKDEILNRSGAPINKVVIRPDSGDPVKIICGDPEADDPFVRKGVVECLWDIFGGTTNDKGYRQLDEHIGAIYGDAITRERCQAICDQLKAKKFTSTNVVYGIGSYTYQYNTRDTFGFALKSTHVVIDDEGINIFKDPKTDNGLKKSQKGRVIVFKNDKDELVYEDQHSIDEVLDNEENLLELVYEDGKLYRDETLEEIRGRVLSNI